MLTTLSKSLSSSTYLQVVDVKQSSVNMVPSKVEVTLRKADQVAWGKLEDPNYKPEPEPEEETETAEAVQPDWDIDDDDISDSDEEWAYDTPENKRLRKAREDKVMTEEELKKNEEAMKKNEEEIKNLQMKAVEMEIKKATEERERAEEEKRRVVEQRKKEEAGEYEDMPELE